MATKRGELLLGGAFNPLTSALLIFTSEDTADSFATGDPYVTGGLVVDYDVLEWSTVAGTLFESIDSGGHGNAPDPDINSQSP